MDKYMPCGLQYVENLICYRLAAYFPSGGDNAKPEITSAGMGPDSLKNFIGDNQLTDDEATLLLISLVPHTQPDLFDKTIESKLQNTGDFPKLGGVRGKNSRSFLPTGETALFLLAGEDAEKRLEIQKLFWADHLFGQKKILWLEEMPQGEPVMSGRIIMSQDYVDTFLYGKPAVPHFSISFPAKLIQTELTWDDLVIDKDLKQQVDDILNWLRYNDELLQDWGMQSRLKKGYRTLFYGPPGTGKTFTAGLLGKYTGKDVYKIDLSMVVSKYIGETEKNLELLFSRAEDKGWILFFDEADALFGKRTNVRDAHDKYANQEVSYLLQRIEDYNGLIILATNMKGNIDDAFIRRFNSMLKFSFPDAEQRATIWRKSFPPRALFRKKPISNSTEDQAAEEAEAVDILEVIKRHELTGGNIINVVHYAGIKAVGRLNTEKELLKNGSSAEAAPQLTFYLTDVLDGIRKELIKEGKPFIA